MNPQAAPGDAASLRELIQQFELRLDQLAREYEQYFLGRRRRAPEPLRAELRQLVARLTQRPIPSTRDRFRFQTLAARFRTYQHRWDQVLRQIEEGTYAPHHFRAALHGRRPAAEGPAPAEAASASPDEIHRALVEARQACGQPTGGLTPERVRALLEEQRERIRATHGCRDVAFRVVVEGGRARLKARPVPA